MLAIHVNGHIVDSFQMMGALLFEECINKRLLNFMMLIIRYVLCFTKSTLYERQECISDMKIISTDSSM